MALYGNLNEIGTRAIERAMRAPARLCAALLQRQRLASQRALLRNLDHHLQCDIDLWSASDQTGERA
ncbi:MAG: hypothetical protein JOY70_09205 [Acidisphaera sp.]|nr:hypothetical protein [Acidisphaera sp.]MBV9812745.1 hypothetical protein [Acetobacteraceae bacterium]